MRQTLQIEKLLQREEYPVHYGMLGEYSLLVAATTHSPHSAGASLPA